MEPVQVVQQREVVRGGFAEAEAGVQDHIGDTSLARGAHAFAQEVADLGHDIGVVWVLLHRGRRALHVHQHVGYGKARNGVQHHGIQHARTDIVHQGSTGLHGGFRHAATPGIDADPSIREPRMQRFDHRDRTFELLFLRDLCRARPRAGATHIEDGGALHEHSLGQVQGRVDIHAAFLVEGIRRGVQDAHYQRKARCNEPIFDPPGDPTAWNTFARHRAEDPVSTGMDKTLQQYDAVIAECLALFGQKAQDYGTAWRILRVPSLTDQIFIKAQRIRTLQQVGESRVGEGIRPELIGIINYAAMALVQLERGVVDTPDLDAADATVRVHAAMHQARDLMQRKNHDYGEAWRSMRVSSLVDLILMKLLRIKQIEDNAGATLVSEGIDANFLDIVNYGVFAMIRMEEDA